MASKQQILLVKNHVSAECLLEGLVEFALSSSEIEEDYDFKIIKSSELTNIYLPAYDRIFVEVTPSSNSRDLGDNAYELDTETLKNIHFIMDMDLIFIDSTVWGKVLPLKKPGTFSFGILPEHPNAINTDFKSYTWMDEEPYSFLEFLEDLEDARLQEEESNFLQPYTLDPKESHACKYHFTTKSPVQEVYEWTLSEIPGSFEVNVISVMLLSDGTSYSYSKKLLILATP